MRCSTGASGYGVGVRRGSHPRLQLPLTFSSGDQPRAPQGLRTTAPTDAENLTHRGAVSSVGPLRAVRPSVRRVDPEELIKALTSKREGYADDLAWEKFLLDAYAGTGGFQGKVRQPLSGFWGPGSAIYSRSWSEDGDESDLDTYLDRFPREDLPKFRRRASMAHYPNPVEPVVDLRLSYLHRRPPVTLNIDPVEDFLANADGQGRSWDTLLHDTIHLRAEILGWCPVLFDMPRTEDPVTSRADAERRGIQPYAMVLFPGQIYDWSFDKGTLRAVKIGTWWDERPDLLGPCVKVHGIALWYQDRVVSYEIVKGEDGKETIRNEEERPNPWGEIPLRVCVPKPSQLPLRGLSSIGTVAKLSKRLFNYLSELDEHLRSSTFALLQVPTNSPQTVGTVLGGAGNALPIHPDSSVEYKFLNPDTAIPVVYEKRIEATEKAIERNAKTGYSANETKQVQSGVSKAFSFENMNRSLADTAKHHAAFSESALRLVAKMDGASDDAIASIVVTPQTRFDVEELASELENALAARSLPLGPTAVAEMTKRLVRQLLPNIEPEKLAKIDSEIDGLALEAEQARAAQSEMATAEDPLDDDPADPNEAGAGGAKKAA